MKPNWRWKYVYVYKIVAKNTWIKGNSLKETSRATYKAFLFYFRNVSILSIVRNNKEDASRVFFSDGK